MPLPQFASTTLTEDVARTAASDATADELLAAATQAADRACEAYVAAMRDALFAFAAVEVARKRAPSSPDVGDALAVAICEIVALAGAETSQQARTALSRLTEVHRGVRIAKATDAARLRFKARLTKHGVTG